MESQQNQSTSQTSPLSSKLPPDFQNLLEKTARLKDFAVKNGYDIDHKTIKDLNELVYKVTGGRGAALPTAADRTNLDSILADLTALTFPTTIESIYKSEESPSHQRFSAISSSSAPVHSSVHSLASRCRQSWEEDKQHFLMASWRCPPVS